MSTTAIQHLRQKRTAIMLTNEANTKPMTSIELDELAKISVLESIESELLAKALISPPFILLESNEKAKQDSSSSTSSSSFMPVACLNFRDSSSLTRTPQLRSRMVYRAGKSSFNGNSLKKLGISRIYDLRSQYECERDPHSKDQTIMQDIQIRWFPPRENNSIIQQLLQESFVDEDDDVKNDQEKIIEIALAKSYLTILFSHQEIFRQILLDLVPPTSSQNAILIHCTAGKDRTGVAIAMLHSFAGCSNEGIAKDYALTRIGVEPARAHLLNAVRSSIPNFSLNDPRFLASSESKEEVMILFLKLVEQKLNGFEGYAKNVLGLTKEEILSIKSNLTSCS